MAGGFCQGFSSACFVLRFFCDSEFVVGGVRCVYTGPVAALLVTKTRTMPVFLQPPPPHRFMCDIWLPWVLN